MSPAQTDIICHDEKPISTSPHVVSAFGSKWAPFWCLVYEGCLKTYVLISKQWYMVCLLRGEWIDVQKGEDEIITHLTVGFLLMQFLLYWLIVIILILMYTLDGRIVIYLIEKRYRTHNITLLTLLQVSNKDDYVSYLGWCVLSGRTLPWCTERKFLDKLKRRW